MRDSNANVARPLSRSELQAFHLREWELKDDRLASIVHNLMPLAGVTVLGWSAGLTLWSLWLDGLVALGLTVALLTHRASLDPPIIALSRRDFAVAWMVLMALLGLPYYLGLVARWSLFVDVLQGAFVGSWLTVLAFAVMVGAAVLSVRGRWHAEREVVPRDGAVAREVIVHVVRAIGVASLLMIEAAPVPAVFVLTLLYTYLETFPNTLLMVFVGHPAPGSPYEAWKKRYNPEVFFERQEHE
ncbi:MAG: hypothetical protein E2P02_19385 [Acidobacteria bacterium]|nr:MAG: hypothetical protein E2P02_19385 [Acidobacteriota bacterium]